jgi:hypothetical protein
MRGGDLTRFLRPARSWAGNHVGCGPAIVLKRRAGAGTDRWSPVMPIQMILLPVFVQIVLTFVLWSWMAYYRATMVTRGEVNPRDVDLRQPNWPPHVLKVSNAAHNQIELPLLFYVLTILAIIARKADLLFVVLAWIFVLSRIAHAYIHVTSNRVAIRGPMFGIGLLVLAVMWIIFIVRILAAI